MVFYEVWSIWCLSENPFIVGLNTQIKRSEAKKEWKERRDKWREGCEEGRRKSGN